MNILMSILIQLCMYIILAIALNLLVGYAGLVSSATAGLFGIGGYVTALLALHFKLDFFIIMITGGIVAAFLGVLVSLPALRLKGDYFFITTMGFTWIAVNIMTNWMDVTRGPIGLPGIPSPRILGISINSRPLFFVVVLIITGLCIFAANRVCNSPFGRALKGMREDDVALEALGKDVAAFRAKTFTVYAILCGVAGAIYAYNMRYVDPTAFTPDESIFVLSMVVLGGVGSIKGSIVGVLVLGTISEGVRYIGLPASVAFQARQIIYGLVLILFMRYRPQGIFGEYKIT
ncbi:branched-chain amino acid ABC transporter permease [Synergistales bacterium]|nr:branched-chain amino acid ABC transporter permease [Synergistales bacterium]